MSIQKNIKRSVCRLLNPLETNPNLEILEVLKFYSQNTDLSLHLKIIGNYFIMDDA